MIKKRYSILTILMIVVMLVACGSYASMNNQLGASPPMGVDGLIEGVEQLVDDGVMNITEAETLKDFIENNQGKNVDVVREAVDGGLMNTAQADALKLIMDSKGPAVKNKDQRFDSSQKDDMDKLPEKQGGFLEWFRSLFGADEGQGRSSRPFSESSGVGPGLEEGSSAGKQEFGQGPQTGGVDMKTAFENLDYVMVDPPLDDRFEDNKDGTITDTDTGLIWQQDPGVKMTWSEAYDKLDDFDLAGYSDWRMPTISELYSLIDFENGVDVSPSGGGTIELTPFIDSNYFEFEYGDENYDGRVIDSQYMSSTRYVADTMNGSSTVFGVNFADGRIKGYGMESPRGEEKEFFVMYVRGESKIDDNDYIDNGDGTVTDTDTGLMWMQVDSGILTIDGGMDWYEAMKWADELNYAGYDDWRVPTAIELQGIVDYTKSPSTTDSPAIDDIFKSTAILDEGGNINYAYYWTSDSHNSSNGHDAGVYIAFGEALGYMSFGNSEAELMDVHGAGAQRSDPKTGEASDYEGGRGPQGDVVRIDNYVRLVRDID